MQANETMGTGAVLELIEPADGSRLLDTMAKAPWPQNALASILGITLFQAASLVDACPESLGDISYMLGHISVSQPDYETMLREFYQEHHTVAELAARRHVGALAVQRQLVELISCIRGSHLPGILSSGLQRWKNGQGKFRTMSYSEQRGEPLWVLEKLGVCEIAWLQTIGVTTVGALIDAFMSETGLQYDGRQLSEKTVHGIYDELQLIGVFDKAGEAGVLVGPCRSTPHTNNARPDTWGDGIEGPWPLNLWRNIMAGGEYAPPADLDASIDAALRLLPPQSRMILLLVYRDGAVADEVGKRMGMKGSAVYAAKRRALDACRESHIMRLLRCGLAECMRQDEEFKSSSIQEMRAFPMDMLPLQMMTSKARAEFVNKTVGDIVDTVVAGVQEAGRTAAKQKLLTALYQMLQTAGVVQRYWAEGGNIPNPSSLPLSSWDGQLECFLLDLWSPIIVEAGGLHELQTPADIGMRIHYAMGCALTESERQKLVEAYPAVTGRTPDKTGSDGGSLLDASAQDVPYILSKLRTVPSLIPSAKMGRAHSTTEKRQVWPMNFLLRVFQCPDETALRKYIPELPPDLEQAIDYILDTRLAETNAKIVRMYFRKGMTCRMVGVELDISGAYVGTVIKNSLENTLRSYECKRYFSLGYAVAKREELAAREKGAPEEILSAGIERLALPQRVINVLRRGGISTVEEAVGVLDGGECKTKGLGSNGMLAIYDAMDAAGVLKLYRAKGRHIKRPAVQERR